MKEQSTFPYCIKQTVVTARKHTGKPPSVSDQNKKPVMFAGNKQSGLACTVTEQCITAGPFALTSDFLSYFTTWFPCRGRTTDEINKTFPFFKNILYSSVNTFFFPSKNHLNYSDLFFFQSINNQKPLRFVEALLIASTSQSLSTSSLILSLLRP